MSAIPTVVAVGTVASGTGAISPGYPANINTGDILVMFCETNNQTITATGWTQASSSPQSEATHSTRLTVLWCRYDGTQGNTTSDSGDHQVARIIAIRGCIAYGDPFNITSGSTDATSSTSVTIPGVTTTVANTLVLTAVGVTTDLASTTNFGAPTNASLGSLTERMDNIVTAGLGGGFGVHTGTKATAGATGNTTLTLTNAARKTYWSGALLPATAMSNLADNFDDNSMDTTKWVKFNDTNVTISESSGTMQAAMSSATGGQYGGYVATGYYDMTGDGAYVKFANVGNQALEMDIIIQLLIDSTNNLRLAVSVGYVYIQKMVAGVDTTIGSLPYVPGTHNFFRIRESGGTTYWDYATIGDGSDWSNLTSQANPIAVTALRPELIVGIWGAAGSTTVQMDNFNTPAVTSVVCTPTTKALTLTTFAPTVSVSNNQLVTPNVTALTLTTFAPTVTVAVNTTVVPTTAALTLTTFAPTVSVSNNQLVTAGLATLTITTFAPTVSVSNNQLVTPTTKALTIATFAPSVIVGNVVTPTTKALTITTFAPSVIVGNIVTPAKLSLTLTTFAPTVAVSNNQLVTPTTKALTITTFAPTVTASNLISVTPTTKSLVLTTFAPTVTVTSSALAVPTPLALILTTYAPTVTVSEIPTVEREAISVVVAQVAADQVLVIADEGVAFPLAQPTVIAVTVQQKTSSVTVQTVDTSLTVTKPDADTVRLVPTDTTITMIV